MAPAGRTGKVLRAAGLLLAAAGAALAARPAVHLARRAHAGITARTTWVQWVQSGKAPAATGDPAGWMTLSSAGIDTIVLWGDSGENLSRYPSLSDRFASFAEPRGVKVVAAHRDTHFNRLGSVRMGDTVRLLLRDGRILRYRICDIDVLPRELAAKRIAEKSAGDWLVLMTCYPFTFAGPAPDRFLVWARPAGDGPLEKKLKGPPTLRAGGRLSFPSPPDSTGGKAGASSADPPSAREGRFPASPQHRACAPGLTVPGRRVRYGFTGIPMMPGCRERGNEEDQCPAEGLSAIGPRRTAAVGAVRTRRSFRDPGHILLHRGHRRGRGQFVVPEHFS